MGEQLGEYELLDKLGEGGMGEVFLARHTKRGTPVAIKVLKASLSADDKLVQRFWGEAKAAASIQHPAIAQVLDVGRTPDGAAFLVMEYLRGETLRHRLRRDGPMAERQAVGFVKQLASVLSAAHDKGIVHRDIKPENIFIIDAPEIVGGERVKLLDFGVAKLTDPQSGMNLTQTGDVIGTPMYMSPEQCRGTGQYDARTDLYSLGCVMFEMICGRPPFVSKFPGDIMAAHIGTPPPKASELRQVSGHLEGLLKKLLEKGPENRVPDANALLVVLDSLYDDDATVLDGAPMMTRASSSLEAATIRPGTGPRKRTPSAAMVMPQETTLTSAAGSTGEVPAAARNPRTILYTVGASLVVAATIVVASLGGSESANDSATTPRPAAAPPPVDRATGGEAPALRPDPQRPEDTTPAAKTEAPEPTVEAQPEKVAEPEPEPEPDDETVPASDSDKPARAEQSSSGKSADTAASGDKTSGNHDSKRQRRTRTRRTLVNSKRTRNSGSETKPKKTRLRGNEAINPFK